MYEELDRLAESCLPPAGSMQRALTEPIMAEIKRKIIEALRESARAQYIIVQAAIRERDEWRAKFEELARRVRE